MLLFKVSLFIHDNITVGPVPHYWWLVTHRGTPPSLNSPCELKHPILLPSTHRFTEFFIQDTHFRLVHTAVQGTLNELRDRYWILCGRQVVCKVLHSCLECRLHRFSPQTMPISQLPRERISEASPSELVWVDFCGPLYPHGVSDREAYIAVFSCGVTCAIHLKLVSNISATGFLLAFRQFISRCELPSIIYSDNARSFHH